jgi:hypothetical protein
MAYNATTKAARAAARTAALAAAEELAARTRANMADLAAFFSARERAEAVDDWLAEKVTAAREQARVRREEQRRAGGVALAAMAARGESARSIAGMAGLEVKAVRELLRLAESRGVDAGREQGAAEAIGPPSDGERAAFPPVVRDVADPSAGVDESRTDESP